MIFHIAICSPDGALRSRLEHQCMEFFARREDACIVEQRCVMPVRLRASIMA